MNGISLYIIPPALSIAVCVTLAVIAITHGRLKTENILLSLVCVWFALPPIAFVSHHLVADVATLLRIERSVHLFYVFIPTVNLVFFHHVMKVRRNWITAASLLISAVIAAFTQTDLYFHGFYRYGWGYIAKGGPAFHVFSLHSFAALTYIIVFFLVRMRREENPVMRTKIGYLFFSFIIVGLLTMTNVPAMNGVDIYPLGNFSFIPLAILAYGILRYNLMNISSVLYFSAFWLILSSLIVIPNIAFYLVLRRIFLAIHPAGLFGVFIVWFFLNYFYFNKIQPVIDRMFNRYKYNLMQAEKHFLGDISLLKNLDDMVSEFARLLTRTLAVGHAHLYIRHEYSRAFMTAGGGKIVLDPALESFIREKRTHLDKHMIVSGPGDEAGLPGLLDMFDTTGCNYLFPLLHKDELHAVLMLPDRKGERLTGREVRFVGRICAYASIALANSLMYDNLTRLKDNLEKMVTDRTAIIEKQKAVLEKEIQLAQEIQMALLPNRIPDIPGVEISFKYVPIMGVGGDFIDIHYRRGMNDLGLFICDVSGHGVSSALIASMVKMSLNSWGRFVQKPAEALTEMKRNLAGKMGGSFITACICCLDIRTGRLVSANAGHPPLIIARRSGAIDVVRSRGRVFLDFLEPDYEEAAVSLSAGDKIILYTDGIIEARNGDGEMLGEEEFITMIRGNSPLSAGDFCRRMYDDLLNFTGNGRRFEDDFALLVAEYLG